MSKVDYIKLIDLSVEDKIDLIHAIVECSGQLENLQVWDNDSYFFLKFFEDKDLIDLAKAVALGYYIPDDDYVQLDEYGNVYSYSRSDYLDMFNANVVDVIDFLDNELNSSLSGGEYSLLFFDIWKE